MIASLALIIAIGTSDSNQFYIKMIKIKTRPMGGVFGQPSALCLVQFTLFLYRDCGCTFFLTHLGFVLLFFWCVITLQCDL